MCLCMMVLIHQHWFITWTLARSKYEEFSIFYPLWHSSLTLMGIFLFHISGSGQRKCLFWYYEQFLIFVCNSVSFLQLSSIHQDLRHLDFESSFFIKQLEKKQTKRTHIPQTSKNWRSLLNLGSCLTYTCICVNIYVTQNVFCLFLCVYLCTHLSI